MSVDTKDVEAIARLARIRIDPAYCDSYASALSRILELVEQMNAADTADVETMANPHDLAAALRADVVTEADQRELFQSVAPAVEDGLYLVPKVID